MQANNANQADAETGSTPQAAPAPIEAATAATGNANAPQSSGLRPCPYCGHLGENDGVQEQCSVCKGVFEPLSRQASQNAMGPWFFHDQTVPFRPGCSYETLKRLITKQRVTGETLIRGPGTNQFWVYAKHAPGVAHLLGLCHNCEREATENSFMCEHCGASFPVFEDRQQLGLAPVRLLPGQANASHVAASALNTDPDESNYGPVAPTFASAAVEQATAYAESSPPMRTRTGETIDESPERSTGYSLRRERSYGRMKATVIAMGIVIVVLLIAIGGILLQSTANAAINDSETPEVVPAVADPVPIETVDRTPDVWTERLTHAESLIATDDPAQLESALEILREIQSKAPASEVPADLAARINRLADTIESAKLRNYLDKDK